jgi:hypothetical protein
MARELGMNPTKLGSIDNHRQEPRKAPLPQFIEHLYFERFGREQPEVVGEPYCDLLAHTITAPEWGQAEGGSVAMLKL